MRRILGAGLALLFLLAVVGAACLQEKNTAGTAPVEMRGTGTFREDFSGGVLNPSRWTVTREGDFRESLVDVRNGDPSATVDGRLRLRLDTIGTRDDTVKFLGVRSLSLMDFTGSREVSLDLDWNNQTNGCYLSASLYLCPTATAGNPEDEPDWLMVGYTGVPPAGNARCTVAEKTGGRVTYLFTDGWPGQRAGRPIGNQHLRILVGDDGLRVLENGRELSSSPSYRLPFSSAYLYLQVGSHSNYPAREILFDNILISRGGAG
ncbi:MAG: hypothetical protein LUQ32_00050 [Methanomicrobiales archaeon]|nr:hypothetical protein [Methanomicrobiales archaeon]